MLTQAALQGIRKYTQSVLSNAKYKIGSTYYDAVIDRIEVTDIDTCKMTVYMTFHPGQTSEVTITEVQLYDTSGKLFLSKTESIQLDPLQEGVLYLLTFEFQGEEVS